MTEQPEQPTPSEQRASDADRERAAKVLQDAVGEGRLTLTEADERLRVVYAAKTLDDLTPVIKDLPGGHSPGPSARLGAAPTSAASKRIGGTPDGGSLFALLSGFDRDGDWVVSESQTAVAILGGGKLDLTEARFAVRECTLQVFTLWGGVDIIVPDDLTVQVMGVGVLGSFDSRASRVGDPDGPVLRITGVALMGAVEVKRRSSGSYGRR